MKRPHRVRRKYTSISQANLPSGRKGKHNAVVRELLEEIRNLVPGHALKIDLEDLPDKKANIRAALSRATQQQGMEIATSSDDHHFYVWVPGPKTP